MPRKTLSDENSNAKRKTKSTSSSAIAFSPDAGPVKKRKILLGNSRYPSQGRVFAREIKNFVGGVHQNVTTPVNDLGYGFGEPSLLNQLVADFETLNLRGIDATRELSTVPENHSFVTVDPTLQSSKLLLRRTLSSRSTVTCRICKGKREGIPGYDTENVSQIYSSAISCVCRRHRFSTSTLNNTKHPSFRSASIASQSTPLPVQVVMRPIHPFYPADDASEAHFQYSVNPGSRNRRKESEIEAHDGTVDNSGSQATDNDNNIMTQITSQLSEVVLSPCFAPVADELMDAPRVDVTRLSQDSTPPVVRLKGRASSFSLGYIPVAFPGEINVKDLRLVF